MSAIQPTPETDAACWMQDWEGYRGEIINSNFARRLERERDEARETERVAVASWDEERLRGQREAERVVALQQQLEAMRKAMREAAAIVAQIPVAYDHRFFRAGQWANAALAQLQPHPCP